MKFNRLVITVLFLLIPYVAYAQQAPQIQQSPTRLDAATKCTSATAAAGSAATATLTPNGANFMYITFIDITAYASAALTGAAAANTATFAGVSGAPVVKLATKSPAAPTTDTGALADRWYYPGPNPLKSTTAGVAVTITTSTQTGMIFNIVACWYESLL